MPTITSPKLARVERVELVRTGTWRLSSGETRFTASDLAAAIAALDCPAIHRPCIKIGHTDPRWDGEPALGWVTNLGLANEGNTLLGDLVGMPAWLGEIAASAFPQRSVEGFRAFRCQIGHTHPFVVTAVSLLGVTPPGVGTLSSLQDHPSLTAYTQAMYGLAASDSAEPGGEPVIFTFPREEPVPDPQPVAAAVDLDDLRDAFYDGAPSGLWITAVQLQPMQLIVTSGADDDATYRIPFTIGADESISFGTPVPVEVTYVDAPVDPGEIGPVGVAASAAEPPKRRAVFARPAGGAVARDMDKPVPVTAADDQPAKPAVIPQTDPMQAPTTPPSPAQPVPQPPGAPAPVEPAAEPEPTTEPEKGDDVSLSDFRSRLGLPDDADEAAVLAAFDERLKNTAPEPQPVAAAAAKREQEFAAALGQIQTLSSELAAVKAEKAAEKKTAFFAAAISQGKLKPADRESWESRYDKAPDLITDIIDAISPGTAVPVAAKGYVGDPEPGVSDDDLLMLLPPAMRDDAKVGA